MYTAALGMGWWELWVFLDVLVALRTGAWLEVYSFYNFPQKQPLLFAMTVQSWVTVHSYCPLFPRQWFTFYLPHQPPPGGRFPVPVGLPLFASCASKPHCEVQKHLQVVPSS